MGHVSKFISSRDERRLKYFFDGTGERLGFVDSNYPEFAVRPTPRAALATLREVVTRAPGPD